MCRLPDLEWVVQPQPQDLTAGADLHLEAIATGQAPLHYQWLLGRRPLHGWELNTITIPAVTPADQGQYACQVEDGRGQQSISQAALIRISERWADYQPGTQCECSSLCAYTIVCLCILWPIAAACLSTECTCSWRKE